MMFKLFILLLSAVQLLANKATKVEDRLVGGMVTGLGEFPFVASVQDSGSHVCGASIINSRWLLTSAQCIYGILDTSTMSVVVGATNLTTDSSTTYKRIGVERLVVHPYYSSSTYQNDVGLIKVAENITYNANVRSIRLNTTGVADGTQTVTIGWGKQYSSAPTSSNLQRFITLPTMSQLSCFFSWLSTPLVGMSQMCTVSSTTSGLCYGDSGDPMIVGQFQVGIASFGRLCATGKPDVYTRVSNFYNWILQNAK